VTTPQQAAQVSTIVPILTVDDLPRSIAFYEALGFSVEDRWEDQGTLLGVMVRAGGMRLGLNQDDWKKGRDRKKGVGVRLAIATTRAEVDALASRAKSAGVTLKSEPHDSEEGRSFELVDPSGFLLTVFSDEAH
jgi:predicted lactoylglutathione lyase